LKSIQGVIKGLVVGATVVVSTEEVNQLILILWCFGHDLLLPLKGDKETVFYLFYFFFFF
jgi:hypothetical protein